MLKTEVFSEKPFGNAITYHPNDESRTLFFTYNQLWNAITDVRKKLEDSNLSGCYIGVASGHSPALIAIVSGIHLSNSAFCSLKVSNNPIPLMNTLKRISTSYCFFNTADTKLLLANQIKFKVIADLNLLQELIVLLQFEFDTPYTKTLHNIAYCVATSGSTGDPKFVRVPTDCILPNLVALEKLFKLGESDRILVSCPPTFDPFVVDVFMALRNGACLILVANEIRLDAGRLRKIVFEQNAVTFMQITPSYLRQWSDDWIRNVMLAKGSSLRHLVLGGEPFPIWLNIPVQSPVEVYNIYGITEVSCWATIELVTAASTDEISLGKPIDETIELQLRDVDTGQVLSVEQRPIRGNLHIGSRVRKCVVGNELAEQVFACDTICYRSTGDLVELQSDGKFYYLGRCDDVVKRFGVRVNLGWLERCADQCKGISKSCAIFETKRHRIVLLYTVCDRNMQKHDLRKLLGAKLKQEEMPDECIQIDKLPLSDHGKTDRRKCFQQLQEIDSIKQGPNKGLKQFFNEKLFNLLGIRLFPYGSDESKRTKFDLGCSFIDAGGTSIQALQLVTSLQDCSKTTVPDLIRMLLDKSVPFNDIFHYLDEYHAEPQEGSSQSPKVAQELEQLSIDISIKTHFNMDKCIDASPTEYYSEKHRRKIVAVGSHSHKVLVVDAENDLTITELVLPDRVESAVSYLVGEDFGFVGCYDGKLYCFDIFTGSIRWSFDSGGMIKCKALVIESVIIFGCYAEEHNLFALNLDGSQIWKTHLGSKGILSSPVFLGNGSAFVATLDGTYCCFIVKTKVEVWRGKLESPVFANAVHLQQHDLILIAEVQGRIHCLTGKCGTKLWCISTAGNLFSSPKVVNTNDDLIDILVGCHDKHLYCFCFRPGKYSAENPLLKWKLRLQAAIYATPCIVNRLAVVCSTSGWINVICLDRVRPIGVLKLDGEVFSTPLIVDLSVVYVGCRDNKLYKLSLCK
ncbi:beta-alanine-activating enzyme [Ochlerotatus camptorhynchus]|uniref:beta-alanine-activating enzyme n=1 Tax=Ochlerotatus camptorhynchus TaxID=644619 RepID=UPI0031D32696